VADVPGCVVSTPPVADVPDRVVSPPRLADVPDRVVSTPRLADVPDRVVSTPRLADVPNRVVSTPRLADVPNRVVSTPRLADVAHNVVSTPRGDGGAGETRQQCRRGPSAEHAGDRRAGSQRLYSLPGVPGHHLVSLLLGFVIASVCPLLRCRNRHIRNGGVVD